MNLQLSTSIANTLNQDCFCITLDRDRLHAALLTDSEEPLTEELLRQRPNMFSNIPMFVSTTLFQQMHATVLAVEAAARLPEYRERVLSWAPEIARPDFGPQGVFMGYDFHLSTDGPRLIEINTNAGGAFLNARLAEAQRACCVETEDFFKRFGAGSHYDDLYWAMFIDEWHAQGHAGIPQTIAIVDDDPEAQYLFPEFGLARNLFSSRGVKALIVDAKQLQHDSRGLTAHGEKISMVYNRLVDFDLSEPVHEPLRRSYLEQSAVITPNPHLHAMLADKRNLAVLSDVDTLVGWGLPPQHTTAIGNILRTRVVTADQAEEFWAQRKKLFFKPMAGYGSKAVYRGDKLTRGVWNEILKGGYVA
ncbi:MAG: hypothetical protein WD772_00805, partial [Pseudohongiellaceae bacterium]